MISWSSSQKKRIWFTLTINHSKGDDSKECQIRHDVIYKVRKQQVQNLFLRQISSWKVINYH